MDNLKQNQQAFSLVEVLVALGIFAILAAGVFNVVTNSFSNFYGTGDRFVVTAFAQEGIEAVRAIRDNSWKDIEDAVGANNGVSKNASGVWQFSGTSDTLGGLTRVITLADVSRGDNGNIVTAGGTNDPSTKKVTVTVSGTGIADYAISAYITDWGVKVWKQDTWHGIGSREFWSSTTTASSSYSGINTSTVSKLKLAGASAGSLVSSIYDIGSTDQELRSVTVNQLVSNSCDLQVTLEASNSIDMSSASSQVFSDNSTDVYTSTTDDVLNGKRWLRYKVDMPVCSVSTTTLYGIEVRYR